MLFHKRIVSGLANVHTILNFSKVNVNFQLTILRNKIPFSYTFCHFHPTSKAFSSLLTVFYFKENGSDKNSRKKISGKWKALLGGGCHLKIQRKRKKKS